MKPITKEEYASYIVHQESFTKRLWKVFVEFAKIYKLDLGSCFTVKEIKQDGVCYTGWSFGEFEVVLPSKFIYDRKGWEADELANKEYEEKIGKELRLEREKIAIEKVRKLFEEFPNIKGAV